MIIRVDGKAFSRFTKRLNKPWDMDFISAMEDTAMYLVKNIQGCKLAYFQSDEISLLLTDYEKETTQGWFDYKVEKMASISAAFATAAFNSSFYLKFPELQKNFSDKRVLPVFDSRCFSLPKNQVNDYFYWRQADAIRNSVQMLARAHFSHKQCNRKSNSKLKEMLLDRGISWENQEHICKFGACLVKEKFTEPITFVRNGIEETITVNKNRWIVDRSIPLFKTNKEYIQKYL